MTTTRTLAETVALLLLVGAASAAPAAEPGLDQLSQGGWTNGRATFYGNAAYNGDGYSIDQGHCMYGGIPGPRYIAALSIWEGFGGDWRYTNCGRCFEIKCRNGDYSNCRGDRMNASLIVMVTDKCPCNRWCCGDQPHFDLSFWGFGEIGNHGGGVISTSWRPIQCPENMGKGGELVLNPQEYEPYCQKSDSVDIMQTAEGRGLTYFVEALKLLHLDDDIEGKKRKYSVLAPTNDAFDRAARLFNTTVPDLLSKPFMKQVMANHIIREQPGEEDSESTSGVGEGGGGGEDATMVDGIRTTLAGTNITVRAANLRTNGYRNKGDANANATQWLLVDGDALILETIQACNGEIDVVNKLIMPYENLCAQDGKASLYDLAQKKGLESFLAAAQAQEGNVGEVMKSLGKVTVFAPTEGASSGSNPIDDYVVLGDQRLDHFTANCTDLSLTGVEVDELRNVSSCAVAKSLGLCNQPWIAKGYCPRRCGECLPRSDLDVGFELRALSGDAMRVYPGASKAPRDHPFDLIVNGTMKIVDYEEACNGMLYVLDKA